MDIILLRIVTASTSAVHNSTQLIASSGLLSFLESPRSSCPRRLGTRSQSLHRGLLPGIAVLELV